MLFSIRGGLDRRTYALLSIVFIPINAVMMWLLSQIPPELGLPDAVISYPQLPFFIVSWSNFWDNRPLQLLLIGVFVAPVVWAGLTWMSLAIQSKRLRAIGWSPMLAIVVLAAPYLTVAAWIPENKWIFPALICAFWLVLMIPEGEQRKV